MLTYLPALQKHFNTANIAHAHSKQMNHAIYSSHSKYQRVVINNNNNNSVV